MRFSKYFFALSLASAVYTPASLSAALIHDYQLQGSLSDSLGGPALVSLGGTISSTGYTFGANQGLFLNNGLSGAGDVYTIALRFSLSSLDGYRKIIDYKNLSTDNGVYNLNTGLSFYNSAFDNGGDFSPNTMASVVVTRDAAGNFVGYFNGVQKISFNDTTSLATFSAANNIINFFVDDFATGQREASGGLVNRVEIFDTALTASQVGALDLTVPSTPSATPEPASIALMGTAAVGLFLLRRRSNQL